MADIIQQDYYIPRLVDKLEAVMRNCVKCILAERKRGKREGFLRPIPKEDAPLLTYHIDHLGPMELTTKKYRYLFVVIDAFTKFAWLYPTKTTNVQEVLSSLEKQQKTFGNPRRIVSDKGSAFTSTAFRDYIEREEIEHVLVTTGVPRGNGQVERVNQVIIPLLTKLSHEKPEKWYLHVDRVQRCINSTYQRSIAKTPFEILTGVRMRQKEDVRMLQHLNEEMVEIFDSEREKMRQEAKRSIEQCQEVQRRGYDRKCKSSRQYNLNDVVAIERTQYGPGLKLKGKYLGPYVVVDSIGRDRYALRKTGSGEGPNETTASADHMKPWPNTTSGTVVKQDGRVE